ncbi:MAG: hypothetical protein ACOYD0_13090 [Candidatus Nanopelagicales bacterium]
MAKYSLTVTEGKATESFALPFTAVVYLTNNIPDKPDYTDLFSWLAFHPIYEVRETVASKTCLDKQTIQMLMRDRDGRVRRALMDSETFRKTVTQKQLLALAKDPELELKIAEILGSLLEDNRALDVPALVKLLVNSPNPQVRQTVADAYGVDKKLIAPLTADEDFAVRQSAQDRLA